MNFLLKGIDIAFRFNLFGQGLLLERDSHPTPEFQFQSDRYDFQCNKTVRHAIVNTVTIIPIIGR